MRWNHPRLFVSIQCLLSRQRLPYSPNPTRSMSTRTYQDAVENLNSLQSNAATLEMVRASGGRSSAFAIPEMLEYLEIIGYKVLLISLWIVDKQLMASSLKTSMLSMSYTLPERREKVPPAPSQNLLYDKLCLAGKLVSRA